MFKTSSIKKIEKFQRKFEKDAVKLLNKLTYPEFYNNFGFYQSIYAEGDTPAKNLIVTSRCLENISARKQIVDTLKQIEYKRTNEWTESSVIGFVDEAIDLLTKGRDEEDFNNYKQEICERYNVASNRIKTILGTFIRNAEQGEDKYNIRHYFYRIEILKYKYQDCNKLQEDIESNKISNFDKHILYEFGMIESI